jgi:hypothetical protein
MVWVERKRRCDRALLLTRSSNSFDMVETVPALPEVSIESQRRSSREFCFVCFFEELGFFVCDRILNLSCSPGWLQTPTLLPLPL